LFKRATFCQMLFCYFLAFIFLPSAAYAASITLAWGPSPDVNVSGYRIYYGTESRNYTHHTDDVGNVTQYTINGLYKNAIYYFAVTSLTDDGRESDFSTEVATSSELAGTAQLYARNRQVDSCEMQEESGDSVEVYMTFNFLRQQRNFIFETEDIRINCHAGTFTQRDDNTIEAECAIKGPLGIFTLAKIVFSGTGNVSLKNPLAMTAEVFTIFNRECPLYVLEIKELLPVQ
jgi:hypothetical protein